MQDLSPVLPLPWGTMSPSWQRRAAHYDPLPEDATVEQVRRPLYGPASVDWDLVDFDVIQNDTVLGQALGLPRETVNRARRARGAKVRKRGAGPRAASSPDMQAAVEELVERMTAHFAVFEQAVEDQIQAALNRPAGAPMPWADLPLGVMTAQELSDRLCVSPKVILTAAAKLGRRLGGYGNAAHPGRKVLWWPPVSPAASSGAGVEPGAGHRAPARGAARAGG